MSVLNTRNKNLHSNAKSVLAEALSSCFFNDPSLSFWWAIRSLLQSFKIRVSQWKSVRGILGGEESVWHHKFKNLWNSGVRWGSTLVRKNSIIFLLCRNIACFCIYGAQIKVVFVIETKISTLYKCYKSVVTNQFGFTTTIHDFKNEVRIQTFVVERFRL